MASYVDHIAYIWEHEFLPRCAAKLAQAEKKFTNEQLEYLNQYYAMNKYPLSHELQIIANQWNINDFEFYLSLDDWFFGRRMAEEEIEEQRYQARIAAA